MIIRRKQKSGKMSYAVRVSRNGRREWIGTFERISDARQAEARARLERGFENVIPIRRSA